MHNLAYTLVTSAAWIAFFVALFIGTWQIIDSYTTYHFKRTYQYARRGKRWTDALITVGIAWCVVFLGCFVGILFGLGILTLMGYGT